jgi:hypothetical protein
MPSSINTKKLNDARSMDLHRIEAAILKKIATSPARLTPQHLE